MPLVQSLDILRQRVTNVVFKGVLDDVYERVRSGSALSEAFEAHQGLFPGVYTASLLAGEKSRQPRAGAAPLRQLREGRLERAPQDDLGARLSRDPGRAVDHRRHGHRA